MRQLKINHFLEQQGVLVSGQSSDESRPGSHNWWGIDLGAGRQK